MDRNRCILAVEDPLSEAMAHKLLRHCCIVPVTVFMGFGFGHLKKRAREFNKTAKNFPVFLLTDQDSPAHCPPGIIDKWLRCPRNEGFIFRVAVIEIESWVMADRKAFASFIGVNQSKIPENPDILEKPKEFVLNLVRKHGKRNLRDPLLPTRGSTAHIGPEYNAVMGEFVYQQWDIQRASGASPSLKRAIFAIQRFKSLRV
ncbi:MAG: hypothetical protein KJO08_06710 [Gammaproteobacteria bacterium]|nr:hypothetical protein [Gammaproteobacteria bacterium]NNJ83397.1 hypothetical protein [Gammaproteobacteria bacterium]